MRCASRQASIPVAHRESGWPRQRIRSKLDRSGNWGRTSGLQNTDKRGLARAGLFSRGVLHLASLSRQDRSRPTVPDDGFRPYGGRTSTSSAPSSAWTCLNASRMQRLMRLRSVASAACLREIRIPSRAAPAGRAEKKKVNPFRVRRVPLRISPSNSKLVRMRLSLLNPVLCVAPVTGTPENWAWGVRPPDARDRAHDGR
jgi:hypothetical protein